MFKPRDFVSNFDREHERRFGGIEGRIAQLDAERRAHGKPTVTEENRVRMGLAGPRKPVVATGDEYEAKRAAQGLVPIERVHATAREQLTAPERREFVRVAKRPAPAPVVPSSFMDEFDDGALDEVFDR